MDIRNFFGAKKAKDEAINDSSSVSQVKDLKSAPSAPKTASPKKATPTKPINTTPSKATAKSQESNKKRSLIDSDDEDSNEKKSAVENSPKRSNLFGAPKSAVAEASSETSNSCSSSCASVPKDVAESISWPAGAHVPYSALVATFDAISRVSGRLDKENLFTKLFRAAIHSTPEDLACLVQLASNSVFPAHIGLELGIGDSLLVKAVCEATGRKKDAVEEDYHREGDLGTVALLSRSSQKTLSFAAKPTPLSARQVLDALQAITQIKGKDSQTEKVRMIKSLMVKCQGTEAKYLIRALQGKLRIGTADQTVLVALAHAFAMSPTKVSSLEELVSGPVPKTREVSLDTTEEIPFDELFDSVHEQIPAEAQQLRSGISDRSKRNELAEIVVKRAFSECPDLPVLVAALLSNPLHDIHRVCKLTPGTPVHPMLAKPTKKITEVLQRLSGLAFTMEYKYDGERAQIHLLGDNSVNIFSRNSEDNTKKYPDLMDIIRDAKVPQVFSCVVDAEVVAYDREKNCLLPFQVLSTRKRKVEDGEEEKVKVVLQVFDMLYLNGKSLLSMSLRVRRQLLRASFTERLGTLHFARGVDHVEDGNTEPIEFFMQDACTSMCEGLMVKTLDFNATYEPSKRSLNWLKLKKDYIEGMGICDSVDLVCIGGYKGRGKRTNTYGAYLMACYDPERDEFQSVCKVGTGFSDEDLRTLTAHLQEHILSTHRRPANYNVGDALEPDDWFAATAVWEIQAADLSKSSVHKGGIGRLGEAERGVGLRFPRFMRVRDDKKPEGATTAEQIVDMYYQQGEVGDKPQANDADDDEDYL